MYGSYLFTYTLYICFFFYFRLNVPCLIENNKLNELDSSFFFSFLKQYYNKIARMNLNSVNNTDLLEEDDMLNERTPLISNNNNNNSINSDNQNDLRTQDIHSVSFVNPKSSSSLTSSLINRNNVHVDSCSVSLIK